MQIMEFRLQKKFLFNKKLSSFLQIVKLEYSFYKSVFGFLNLGFQTGVIAFSPLPFESHNSEECLH
jgi:hypothetical protein